jgi:predicted dehydrogenase
MCRSAEARDLVFSVFENFRHTPETRHLRWLFDSDRGGRLQMILMGYVGAWWAPNRIVAETPWRHQRDEAGGIALDLGVHFFDQIRHVAGEIRTVSAQTAVLEPRRVTIVGDGTTQSVDCDADDTFFAQFETEHGVVGNMFASWAGHGGPTLVGSGSVYYGTRGRVSGSQVTFDDDSADLALLYGREAPAERQKREFPLGLDDSFALSQLDWLEAIRTHRQPETTGREGLHDLAAAFAIVESALAGGRVNVSEVLDGTLREYQAPIDERFGLI